MDSREATIMRARSTLGSQEVQPLTSREEVPLRVSIVVGVRNMKNTIECCIESLVECDYPDKEVIVVDDGSTDGTRDVISRYPVRLVSTPPLGISNARNTGFKEAKGDVVAFTDGDCIVTKDWLKKLVQHFDDKDVAVVGGRTVFQRGNDIASVCRGVEFNMRYSKVPKATVSALGHNCAFIRWALEKVGGFDPDWFHGEDAEVSYKLHELGHKIVYEPDAIVYHVPEEGLRRYFRKRVRDASAFVRVSARHLPAALKDRWIGSKLVVEPFLFASSILLLPLAILFVPFAVAIGLMLIIGFLWNFHEATLVSKETGKKIDLLKGLAVLFLRGMAWGLGLIVGILKVVKHRFLK